MACLGVIPKKGGLARLSFSLYAIDFSEGWVAIFFKKRMEMPILLLVEKDWNAHPSFGKEGWECPSFFWYDTDSGNEKPFHVMPPTIF